MYSQDRPENTAIRLSKIMLERGLRQADVLRLAAPICKRANISLQKSALSQYIAGKVEPGQDKIYVLAEALDVNEAWLMGFNVPMDRNIPPELDSDPGSKAFELYTRLYRMSPTKREYVANLFLSQLDELGVLLKAPDDMVQQTIGKLLELSDEALDTALEDSKTISEISSLKIPRNTLH